MTDIQKSVASLEKSLLASGDRSDEDLLRDEGQRMVSQCNLSIPALNSNRSAGKFDSSTKRDEQRAEARDLGPRCYEILFGIRGGKESGPGR